MATSVMSIVGLGRFGFAALLAASASLAAASATPGDDGGSSSGLGGSLPSAGSGVTSRAGESGPTESAGVAGSESAVRRERKWPPGASGVGRDERALKLGPRRNGLRWLSAERGSTGESGAALPPSVGSALLPAAAALADAGAGACCSRYSAAPLESVEAKKVAATRS